MFRPTSCSVAGQPGVAARALTRDSAIVAIVLVDGQVDHTTGLYMLRESTDRGHLVYRQHLRRSDARQSGPRRAGHFVALTGDESTSKEPFAIHGVSGVQWRALPVASKPAPYSPNRDSPVPGDNLALVITDKTSGRTARIRTGTRCDG